MKQLSSSQTKATGTALTFILLCLYYILATAYIPLCLFIRLPEYFSLLSAVGICILACAALARAAGSFRAVVGFALTVGIFAFLGTAVQLVAPIAAFIAAVAVYSKIINMPQSLPAALTMALLPAVSVITVYLASRQGLGVALAILPVPVACTLTWCTRKKLSRVPAICRLSCCISLCVLAIALCIVYMLAGEISISAIRSLIDSARTALVAMLDGALMQMELLLGESLSALGGIDLSSFTKTLAASVFNLLPAIVITVANILAYLVHSLALSVEYGRVLPETLAKDSPERREIAEQMSFDMSLVSAIVYIASLVLAFLFVTEKTALYGTAAENLLLILAPGLVLTAISGVRALSMQKGPSCLGTLVYIGLIFMVASLSPIVIMAVALGGAVLIIMAHIAKHRHDSQSKG